MMDWQPIETAPKDGTTILLWSRYSTDPAPALWSHGKWNAVWDGSYVLEYMSDFGATYKELEVPTHWQPLPESPID